MLKAILESPRGRRGLTWQIGESSYHKPKAQPKNLSTKKMIQVLGPPSANQWLLLVKNDPLVTLAELHSKFKIQQAA